MSVKHFHSFLHSLTLMLPTNNPKGVLLRGDKEHYFPWVTRPVIYFREGGDETSCFCKVCPRGRAGDYGSWVLSGHVTHRDATAALPTDAYVLISLPTGLSVFDVFF